MDWTSYDAALFDLDGVVTPTADVHMAAWAQLFTDYFTDRGVAPYTEADYYEHLDGRPRYDAVRGMLASRGITLPEGLIDDAPEAETVCGLGNRKNEVFTEVLHRDGVQGYPGSVRLIEHLNQIGVRRAVVSSSRNAPSVLEVAGLAHHFELVVDGALAQEQGLAGKPAPDTFAYAARQLGCDIARAVVLEDAVSGVAAGRAGEFGLVVGVDRGAGVQALTDAGADRVVADLDELLP